MSLLLFLASVFGPIIQSWIAVALIFLVVLIMSLPRLIGMGVGTLLIPARRARWLNGRREKRERRRRTNAEIALMQREMEEYGLEEAKRRQLSRLATGNWGVDRSRQPTSSARPDEEPTA